MADYRIHDIRAAFGAILAIPFILICSSVLAQDLGQNDLDQCMEIKAASDRLACFEALATRSKSDEVAGDRAKAPRDATPEAGKAASNRAPDRSSAATAPSAIQATPRPSGKAMQPNDDFGLPEKPVRTERADKIRKMLLASAMRDRRGSIIMTMQNGQVWRQTDKAPVIMPSSGDQAVIEKGFPSGYRMRLNKRTIRVERLK